MSDLGSPLAFALGGGAGDAENAYKALRSAVGVGGSAPGGPEDTIVEAWRWARARGLAAVMDDERAALQCSPLTATDFVPAYEQMLGEFFAADVPDEARRQVLAATLVRFLNASGPKLLEQLQLVAPSAEINYPDRALLVEAQPGRAHEDWDPGASRASGPAFNFSGGRRESSVPNYSDDFRCVVHVPMTAGAMTADAAQQITRVKQVLEDALPCWVTYTVWSASGFVLDQDLLDATVFGDLLSGSDVVTLDGDPVVLDGDPVVV